MTQNDLFNENPNAQVKPNVAVGPVVYGDKIATEPFPDLLAKRSQQTGAIVKMHFDDLAKLQVIYQRICANGQDDCDYYRKHFSHIYVRAETAVMDWAKQIYTLNNKKFILVPTNFILMVEFEEGFYWYG